MSPSIRRRLEIAVGVFVGLVLLIFGGAKLYFLATFKPLYTDPAAIPSTAASADSGRHAVAIEESRRLARALLVAESLPSLSVAVAKDGDIVWAEAFGLATIDPRTPATPLTRFRTGSVSKTLTVMAIGLLYERGRIDLDAPVQRYVPQYPQKQWTVTTRQLLGDVAGVHKIRGDNNDFLPRGHCSNLHQAVETFADEPLAFEPGTKYRYSTYGWILLSAVIEGASGEPFPTFMRREVLEPLGLNRTALEGTDNDADTASFSSMQIAFWFKTGLGDAPDVDYACFAGAGAFLSTPSDLARVGLAVLKPGLLKAETISLLQTPLRLASGTSTGFAPGWRVDSVTLGGAPARVLRHRGSLIGGTTSLSVFRDLGLVIAAMSNITQSDRVDPFALQVAAAFAR